MTEQELATVLEALSRTEQDIYKTLDAEQGPMTAPMLRGPVRRTDGLTMELRRLCELGLVRPLGKKVIAGRHPAMAYVTVPLKDVEKAAERFNVRSPRRRRRSRHSRGPGISQLREMERGDYELWYRVRRRVLELTQMVVQAEKMSFWDAAPEDERELVLAELRGLQVATEDAIAAFQMRAEDDATREKIEKLRETNGRTAAETATARRLARKLEEKL
ncbi:MAG: hypothetical protein H0U16_11870 [Actinobacteria bacterium]|nr:hypothetical protein [Actinomycetota bacterium]